MLAEGLPQQPKNPDDFEKETAQFWEQEKEKAVNALQEAMHIDRAVKLFVDYIENWRNLKKEN